MNTDRMSAAAAAEVLEQQSGVISRRQVLECGHTANDVRRLLRRREWATVVPGVYVNHTGLPTWRQRAWAAVLAAEPAALADRSVLAPGCGPIHIAVDSGRTVVRRAGVVVHRRTRLESSVLWNASPPRLRVEEAALDVADAAADDMDAVAVLSDVVGGRSTTVDRLLSAARRRCRMRRRQFLVGVLEDIRAA
ncbi:hypothetical protein [Gordonia sp. (in: high G+C Gram-positive bacteria)]|uniref:hypothetical protein n=1 Tax=Gordonia sp. (in: high G+C Gram-positive bacteria) TaxID=84139 RepID=UPI0039E54BE1